MIRASRVEVIRHILDALPALNFDEAQLVSRLACRRGAEILNARADRCGLGVHVGRLAELAELPEELPENLGRKLTVDQVEIGPGVLIDVVA